MSTDESDDEPLSVLAASKRLNPESFEGNEEITIEVVSPSKKKKKNYRLDDNVSITIKLQQPKEVRGPKVVERPVDVWMYIKDLNITGPYSCLLCSEWFINRSKIILHYVLNHKKDFCSICRYFVPDREAWVAHRKFHTPWPCSQCCENFPTEEDWRKHFSAVHSLVHCRLCHFRTTDDDQYNLHLLDKHNVTNKESKDAENIWEIEYEGSPTFQCLLCSKGDIPSTTFFNHYMGYHRFTLKCITNIVSGSDPPFNVNGANVSNDFLSGQFKTKVGYKNMLERKENENETDLIVKQEASSDTEDNDKKGEATYNGIEDFDVTLMELIMLQKCYFDYLNNTLNHINGNSVPEDSAIDYKSAYKDVELDIECNLCKTWVTSVQSFETHMWRMHSVKTLPIYTCRVCNTTFDNIEELNNHVSEEMKEFEDLMLCQFCDKEFDSREATRKHLNSHSDVMEYDNCFSPHLGFKCKYCPTLFWNETDRETHQIRVHFNKHAEDFYKCDSCSELFSDKIWYIHHFMQRHNMKQELFLFKCCICCLVLPTIEDMRVHFYEHHKESKKIFCCLGSCVYKPLSQRKSFKSHLKSIHGTESRKKPVDSCSICGREFGSARACSTHMAQAHGARKFKCKLCRDVLHTVDERKLHYLIRHPGKHPYSCPECGKSFQYKSSLYMHKQAHAPHKPAHTCSFCGKVFMKRDSYREHLQIHEGPRHACSYCPMRFVQRSNMLRHERRHTGERPYACPHCPRTFSDKGACTSHVRTHTKERSFSCIYCGQTFVQKSKLTYHLRKHTGENLETCTVCAKLFTSACSLREHMKIHERHSNVPVQCPLCDRKYQDERYMLRHIRTSHTRIRYNCPLCRKSLTSPAGLRLHVVTHGKANMYKCKSCPKTYAVKRTMIRHVRKRHIPKNTSHSLKEFYLKLDPRECNLPLDDDTMTKIFGPPKKQSNDVFLGDFVTLTQDLNLPESNQTNDDTEDSQDDKDSDGESGSDRVVAKTERDDSDESSQGAELEPTDFVSVKIEPMEEDE